MTKNIFEFVKTEETSFTATPVDVADGFTFHFPEHIRHCILIKDGKVLSGADPDMTPIKNIVLPILNVCYRTEGFDLKDIEPYVNDEKNYYKSFLVRKFHEKWARDNDMDTFIDDIVESYVDFGGVLVKRVGKSAEIIPLQKISFCDQTDILSGPFGIKHNYSVDQLLERSKAWNTEAINAAIDYAETDKSSEQVAGSKSKTPGKYIEVTEVNGMFPKSWLTMEGENYVAGDDEVYTRQIWFICEDVRNKNGTLGVVLFKGPVKDDMFKFLKRDKIYGRALGRSQIEELFEPQVWTNYGLIQKKAMLDKLAMILGVTDDATFAQKNKITELENGEWLIKTPNSVVEPFTFPANNLNAFDNNSNEWEQHARTLGSASDPQLGLNPSSGTPLGTTQIITNQGEGIHQYRRGKVATFVQELYRDWFLEDLVEEMNKGQKFIAELSLDELQQVAEAVVTNSVNDMIKEKLLEGKLITNDERDAVTALMKQEFMKGGTKRFHEILKNELEEIPIDVFMNVASKQKNQVGLVEKLSNFLRGVLTLPFVQSDPANAAKVVNTMLESSGISPINFTFNNAKGTQPVPGQSPLSTPSPIQPNVPVVQ